MDAVAISLALLEDARNEPELKSLARAYVTKGRAALFERHRAGAGGLEIVSAWSTVMDHLIRHLYAEISSECSGRIPNGDRSFALVAQGGYGRGELNPHSDIDLLFLYPRRISPFVQAVTEKLQHTLWDAGMEPGHAARSIADCIRLAESDMRVRTSLLDARFLCGDFALFQEFEKKVEPRLVKTGIQRFVREKLDENRARHAQYGGSVYLLEPEVKEGEGGLRDIQTARWIARATLKAKDLEALALNGIVATTDIANLKEFTSRPENIKTS
jgi:[protein-PII] uridylyltransferase